MKYRRPILLVDDEWSDVADLEQALRDIKLYDKTFPIPQHATCPDEAMEKIIDSYHRGRRFAAIITDNHMRDDTFEGLDGDDFLRVLRGNLHSCFAHSIVEREDLAFFSRFDELIQYSGGRENILEFMSSYFKSVPDYLSFVETYFAEPDPPYLAMLCGAPREVNAKGLEGVNIVQKSTVGSDNGRISKYFPCERIVLDLLISEGIVPRSARRVMGQHPRLSSKATPTEIIFRPSKKKGIRER